MNRLNLFLITFIFLSSVNIFALEIDEKLTLRILNTSNTKKTLLINRGLEDGLAVGDHAKFFLTTGVVARAVIVKASPTRTIWSVYRLISPDAIVNDKVMNLKIASPVKLTDDPSKSLKAEATAAGADSINIALGDDANDLPSNLSSEEKGDLAALEGSASEIPQEDFVANRAGVGAMKNLEIWGMLHFNTLSGTFDDPDRSLSGDSSASTLEFSLGGEYYFAKFNNFLKNISITGFISKRSVTLGETLLVTNDWFELGGGLNWHFYNNPMSFGRLIGYFGTSFGFGKVTTEVPLGVTLETAEGNNNFFSAGFGGKYYLPNGFGLRVLADFFRSGETFTFDDNTEKTRSLSGLRAQVGFSYRW